MKKIKEFIKKHPYITAATCLVGGTLIGITIQKKVLGKDLIDMTGKTFISWVDSGKRNSFKSAKEALALNNDNQSMFAIVKYGPDKYQGVALSGVTG